MLDYLNLLSSPTMVSDTDEEILLKPFHHIEDNPGKGTRTLLLQGFNKWFKIPQGQLNVIIQITNMLHNASLLYRDSLERYFKVPTEKEYVDMANKKTSGLFRLAIRLLIACSSKCSSPPSSYITLANLIGVYFQIRDDLLNLISKEYSDAKGFAEDLEEGKFSFPIIHGINADISDNRILETLRQRPKASGPKYDIIEYLKCNTRSFEYTVDSLEHLESLIQKEMAALEPNCILENIVSKLHVDKDKLGI
ncbi:isoprenoid synthase domain-containing protein [Rhodocollybia butyracea]|uniref:(2E,6E)-farnesyl diphosphate synthase n=1 Tax=Rhodocollybia butyracea TaxID=206335 RepID=A0A9P5P786_9AGAR|nr:isoprenoid synthase domain-containing protein [Rhodocollybia butyracea]